jgi:hypothetical protein
MVCLRNVAGQDNCPILQRSSGESSAFERFCSRAARALQGRCVRVDNSLYRILTVLALLSVNEKIFAGEVGSAEPHRGEPCKTQLTLNQMALLGAVPIFHHFSCVAAPPDLGLRNHRFQDIARRFNS